MRPIVYQYREGKVKSTLAPKSPRRSESEPEEGVESEWADAKPSDLHMSRVKSR